MNALTGRTEANDPENGAAAAPCSACAATPSGIEGHDRLRVRTLGGATLGFRCEDCGLLWSRTGREGSFVWTRLDPNAPFNRKVSAGVKMPDR